MTMDSGVGVLVYVVAALVTISGFGVMLLFASDALERWLDTPDAAEPAKERGAESARARSQH